MPRIALSLSLAFALLAPLAAEPLTLHERGYLAKPGVNVLVFSNVYPGLFSDAKMSGIEIIHHGERTVTNGDVRLDETPEQWDALPELVERRIDEAGNAIEATLKYPSYDYTYTARAAAQADGAVVLTVRSEQALPAALVGRAAFNLEFLPSAYWGSAYIADGEIGLFPHYPSSGADPDAKGKIRPRPFARGKNLALAADNPEQRIQIESARGEIALYDGRYKAQNGWFVARELLPANKTGTLVEWRLTPNAIANWIREPMVAYNQAGYHPSQAKVAVIELDANDRARPEAKLVRIEADGSESVALATTPSEWGPYLRYNYLHFDFSEAREPGVYRIDYGEQRGDAFPIAPDVYDRIWHATLDVFLPVQMDHVEVNEAYRVWHGASHLDDARQAPVDHEHFDLYAQGPTTDTPYQPGEHIPGLNIGGWYDAGDYDIRTQTQYFVVLNLVDAWERFRIERDSTLVDYDRKFVDLHHPDGKPDLLQQIEHGALGLIAQHRALGRAIPGIVEAHLSQYTHLGDGVTKTDNKVYDPSMSELESDGIRSGLPDDRWAFTSKTTPLNYGSAAGLAAAARALRGYNDALADECLATAIGVWETEQGQEPALFSHGNTTGGSLEDEQLKAAIELLMATGEQRFADHIESMWPTIDPRFPFHAARIVRALPKLSADFHAKVEQRVRRYVEDGRAMTSGNPFGVPITPGGWAGGGLVVGMGVNNYYLRKAFPDIVSADAVYRSLNYILGCHPDHNLSLVTGIGARTKKVAYGTNRADFSYIAGGVVPGILLLEPDFPENMEDWPFFWGENEYVINVASSYLLLANAARELLEN